MSSLIKTRIASVIKPNFGTFSVPVAPHTGVVLPTTELSPAPAPIITRAPAAAPPPVITAAPAIITRTAAPSWEVPLAPVGVLPVVDRAPAAVPAMIPFDAPQPVLLPDPERPATTAITPYTGSPIVTTAPRPMSAILDTRPVGGGAPISMSPPSGVVGSIINAGKTALTNWATRQIVGSGGRSAAAPAIPAGGGSMPGVGQMGMGGAIATVGGAIGRTIGRVAGSKKVRGVVGGILGWWLVDAATGALLGPADPPRRRMNVLNVKALRRADRRMDGFRKVARKVLSSQGFKVERRGSGRSCAPKRKRSC